VKPIDESGGYGIVVGPRASAAERAEMRARLRADPANYISQPMVRLRLSDTHGRRRAAVRRSAPFATGRDTWVLPGGLRVALRQGS
jgi:uncharacterized circularly permuted ATP-grasp superfamily protein